MEKSTSNLSISVQISTWKRRDMLKNLVKSLCNQSLDKDLYEILVCDSNSNDGSEESVLEIAENFPKVKIKYFNISENTLSAKRNYMFENTHKTIILTLDDDLFINDDFLENHYNAYKNNPDSTFNYIYCGQVRFPDQWIKKSNYYKYRDKMHINSSIESFTLMKKNQVVVMNMSLRKNLFTKKQFMNTQFIKYGGEDQEFELRAVSLGYQFIYLREPLVIHLESSSLEAYLKKIYFSARFGDKTLSTLYPKYKYSGKTQHLKDSVFDFSNNLFKSIIISLALNFLVYKLIVIFLNLTDKLNGFYFEPLYRYVVAYKFRKGLKDQNLIDHKINNQNWI